MAQINYVIPPRCHEIIRDRVGLIVADELAMQAAITYEDLFLAKVYVQRSKPFEPDECPVINVHINSGTLDNHTIIDSDSETQFFIDVFTTGASNDTEKGDTVSSFDGQQLAGVIQAILLNPIYKTLGFAPPFIMRSKVTNFEPMTVERNDSTNMSVVRITLVVKAGQTEPGVDAITTFIAQTQVMLHETDLGYLWSTEN